MRAPGIYLHTDLIGTAARPAQSLCRLMQREHEGERWIAVRFGGQADELDLDDLCGELLGPLTWSQARRWGREARRASR